jgi:hypothetical protein
VLVSAGGRNIRAIAVDADGLETSMFETLDRDRNVTDAVADVGEDGTAAVAWTQWRNQTETELANVTVRLRPPGGQFSRPIVVTANGPVRALDLGVRPDGTAEVVYASWDGAHRLFHTELRAGAQATAPLLVATSGGHAPFLVALLPGGPGRGRVLYDAGGTAPTSAAAPTSLLAATSETPDATWGHPQQLARDGFTDRHSLVASPDGGAVAVFERRGSVYLLRAAPGAGFDAPELVRRAPSGWHATSPALSTSASGHILVGWLETSQDRLTREELCGENACHTRVMTAVANPGEPPGTVQRVSPLGSVVALGPWTAGTLVTAISRPGDRLIAWREDAAGVLGADGLVVVHGDPAPASTMPSDVRRPNVRASVSLASLRAAARGGALRARVACDEACAVRVVIGSRSARDLAGVSQLQAVVLPAGGSIAKRWRLTAGDRRRLRRVLASGTPWLPIVGVDGAGNLRSSLARLIR